MQFPFFRSPWQRAHRGPVLLACAFVLLAASNARASSELDAGTSTNANAGTSAEPARFQLQSIAVENSTVLTATDVEKIASRWRGRFVGGFELFAIQRELSELYEQRGYRGSGVLLGDQAVLQGAVRFHAREVRLSAVVVSPPPRWLRAFVVTNWFAAETNALLNVNRLQDRLSMLRDSPHLTRIDADLSVAQENTSQAVLKLTIEEPFPIAAWLSAANNRNPGIGSVRHEIGVSHRSLLGFGDTLEWRGGRTEGLADTAWSYSLPVPKTRFTMFASRNKGENRGPNRRRHVAVGAEDVHDPRGVAARDALELTLRQLARIADHAALAAAERHVDDGALPRHPRGQRGDLIEGHAGMVADTALGRSQRDVVLDTVAREHLDLAVVALDGARHGDLPLRMGQDLPDAGIEIENTRRPFELLEHRAEHAAMCGHGWSS